MLIALAVWVATTFGFDLSDERVAELNEDFYQRPAVVHLGLGRRLQAGRDSTTLSFGFERYLGRKHWVGMGFTANYSITRGAWLEPSKRQGNPDDLALLNRWTFHPIREMEIFYAIGALWTDLDSPRLLNRFGVGYRLPALHFAPVPVVYVDVANRKVAGFVGAQFEF